MSGVCAVLPLMTAPPAGGCQHDKYNIVSIHCYFKSSSNQCIIPIYLYFFSIRGICFDFSFPSLPTYQMQKIMRNTDNNRVNFDSK